MRYKSIQQLKSSNLSDSAKQQAIEKYEKTCNRNSGVSTNRKSGSKMAKELSLEIHEGQKFTSPVRISFHSIRRKLPDMDNLQGKAVVDAIVNLGILPDDSKKWIPERPTHTSEVGEEEKTIIIIETLDNS